MQKEFFTENWHYTLIDIPGHHRFLKNAIMGIAQADSALVLVPADEMPHACHHHLMLPNSETTMNATMVYSKLDATFGTTQLPNFSNRRKQAPWHSGSCRQGPFSAACLPRFIWSVERMALVECRKEAPVTLQQWLSQIARSSWWGIQPN